MNIKKRAQSAIEFMIIIGAMLFFFVSFMYAIGLQKTDQIQQNRELEAKDIVLSVKDEINLASEASNGYSRSFSTPNQISGFLDYSISLQGTLLYLNTSDGKIAMAYPVLNVTGKIQKGTNMIRKENETIYLN